MKLNSLILLIFISFNTGAQVAPYPIDFPTISCENYWSDQNINGSYSNNSNYQDYYKSTKRKNCYKEWTVLVFMAADNDLTPYALWDIYEMERQMDGEKNLGATTNKIDVIAELDTYNQNGIKRLHIFQTDEEYDLNIDLDFFNLFNEDDILSPIIKTYEEQNNTIKDQSIRLERFITQSIRDYPSKHYMLVIWGHGEGFIGSNYNFQLNNKSFNFLDQTNIKGRYIDAENITLDSLNKHYQKPVKEFSYDKVFGGVAFDYTDVSFLDIPSIKETVDSAMSYLMYDKPLDIIAFDACLMQTLEVATELADTTDYIIGSTQIQDYLGLPYRMILDELNSEYDISPEDIAESIPYLVETAMGEYGYQGVISSNNAKTFTASSISTQALKYQFIPSFMDFSQALIDYIKEDSFRMLDLKVIFQNSPSFLGETRDIGIFIASIEQLLFMEREHGKETDISINLKEKINDLWYQLGLMMFSNTYGPYYTDQTLEQNDIYFLNYFKGMSIWIPSNKNLFEHRIEEFQDSSLYNDYNYSDEISSFEKLLNLIFAKPSL